MRISKLRERLQEGRPATMVSLRIPQDVLDDLKRIAPLLGFSDYQPLLKAYIGQGLRADLERFSGRVEVTTLLDSLRKQGVEESIIANALADAQGIYQ